MLNMNLCTICFVVCFSISYCFFQDDMKKVVSNGDVDDWRKQALSKTQQLYSQFYFDLPDPSLIQKAHTWVNEYILKSADHKRIYKGKLGQISYYLRLYKIYNVDPRTKKFGFERQFPEPYLQRIDKNISRSCNQGIKDCIDAIHDRITDSQFFQPNYFKLLKHGQPTGVRTISGQDEYLNFEPISDNFVFQTTASYYLCWFTLNEIGIFSNIPYCLSTYLRNNFTWRNFQAYNEKFNQSAAYNLNKDPGFDSQNEYRCSAFSFCPDPCCERFFKSPKYLDTATNIKLLRLCDRHVVSGRGCKTAKSCNVEPEKNGNFLEMIKNKWNTTCNCEKEGYVYNPEMERCVDIDECENAILKKKPVCNDTGQVCVNTDGGYMCVCDFGFRPKWKKQSEEFSCRQLKWQTELEWDGPAMFYIKKAVKCEISLSLYVVFVIYLL